MKTDNEYLQCLGLGLQGLRASGQFCDAMVIVGSTRILVHKVVLSAASKTLHDLALEFDMTPHRDRDQLEITFPPDVSLFAVNMFINYLYTGQLNLNERVVNHLLRLSNEFGVTSLGNQCQEFIQKVTAPDSQDLNLQEEKQTEPDSSCTNGAQSPSVNLFANSEDATQLSSLTRSSSRSSGIGLDQPAFACVSIKSEPTDFDLHNHPFPNSTSSKTKQDQLKSLAPSDKRKQSSSMSVLQKLMSPVVNIKKLPSTITRDVVVLISDDESEMSDSTESGKFRVRKSHFTLEEKQNIAREAKRFGTTHVSRTRNIPLADILSWMTIFGLRHSQKSNKPVSSEADLSIVRWISQQQALKGQVELNSMKKCALSVCRQSNPHFTASNSWLESFLKRNMLVLQGTNFVVDSDFDGDDSVGKEPSSVTVKKELLSLDDLTFHLNNQNDSSNQNILDGLGNDKILEDVPYSEEMMLNEEVLGGFDDVGDDDIDDFSGFGDLQDESGADMAHIRPKHPGSVITPFGKRPIIIGQSKSFDAKSERKIVQWVQERNVRDGYVFTDDFKDYARSLYEGSKPFGATQAWMKKFLRRNPSLKGVRFCSKYKNVYTNEEKTQSVAMARRFGVTYASNHTGINPKIIHSWKLAVDRGQLTLPSSTISDVMLDPASSLKLAPSSSHLGTSNLPSSSNTSASQEATHGIVPEFEKRIIRMMNEFQEREGSINYNDISQISQSVYKETRPTFKASYSWIRHFLDRHKEDLKDIELENVSKVIFEDTDSQNVESSTAEVGGDDFSREKISELVDNALKEIDFTTDPGRNDHPGDKSDMPAGPKRPIIVGPSVTFGRKTEKQMVEWALEKQAENGYVFTDDFKDFAKSLHIGPKHFSASSGWMSLFLRRHRILKDVKWKSKFKNNYSEDEKKAAVAEAKRLGTGHVGRKLGIDPALICAWRIKMEKATQKHTFWKGAKIRFGKSPKPIQAKFAPIRIGRENDAARGIVPEFEQNIIDAIMREHETEGSISYEEMSRISQDVYKETRSNFKASYAWIRNFMKRHEKELEGLNIDNVKKVFIPDGEHQDFLSTQAFTKRPIIIGQSRSLDTKSEKKLVEWVVEQQDRDGYVFLDQFKKYAQSLYKGSKKFAATQAWRIKFLRRNHAALKHVRFTSSFRNQYDPREKRAIVEEAKKYGTAHVSKKTGIDHCLINAWRLKMEKSGELPVEPQEPPVTPSEKKKGNVAQFTSHLKKVKNDVGPGLYSVRGVVPQYERKIVELVNEKNDEEGSVSYQDVSNIARAIFKETRPNFKACYNWIKEFIRRNKKGLKHVEFEHSKKLIFEGEDGTEVLIPEDKMDDINSFVAATLSANETSNDHPEESVESWESMDCQEDPTPEQDPMIVIDNPEDPNYSSFMNMSRGPTASTPKPGSSAFDITNIASRKPVVVGTPVHFTRKAERKLVGWLLEKEASDGFVFTDDFRDFARSMYTGPPGKFGATNAWVNKFLRRNKLEKKVNFESRLKGNNPKYEEKIIDLILEKQHTEGSVSNTDIQKITTDVYREIRPNFRACYNWIRDFIRRHKDELAEVELENVKRVFIPDDDNENDGVIVRDFDPVKGYATSQEDMENSQESSWTDMDSTSSFDRSRSHTPQQFPSTSMSVLDKLAGHKRPIIIAPPKSLDVKTEKRLVEWMLNEQEKHGCVYLDLFKQYAKSIHTGPKHFAATQAWMVRFKQRNHDALKAVKICSRFRKEYTIEEKMAAVEEARRLGCNHVGRKLGINGGVIYSWKVQLEQAEKNGLNPEFGGTYFESEDRGSVRGNVPQFDEAIVEQVLELQKLKGGVSYGDVSRIGRQIYQETRPNFKASNNWVLEFIRRFRERFEAVHFENQRKVLTDEEKLHILSEEKKYGTEHVVKKRNISASTIYQWKKVMQAKSIPIPKFKALVGSKIKKKYAKGKKFQKTYTLDEKRKAVAVAEANGITYAYLKLGLSRNVLSKWIRYFRDQGENIVINYTHASTLRKELTQKIMRWVLEENDKLGIVLIPRIQEYAQKVFADNFSKITASRHWLESFITQHSGKFKNVRFREKGATDTDFTDDIKLKVSRYAEKHGAVVTADLTGTAPSNIYHWRRMMKQKGHCLMGRLEGGPLTDEPKSSLQQKLEKVALKYGETERRTIVAEAQTDGTSLIASKYKIPLPLLLKWMKVYVDGTSVKQASTPEAKPEGLLKVRLPSVERSKSMTKYSNEFKREVVAEAKEIGVQETCRRRGIASSTLYAWYKDAEESPSRFDRRSSEKSSRASIERTHSSKASDVEESFVNVKTEPEDSFDTSSTHSASFTDTGSDMTPGTGGLYVRYVRKYSEEEKIQAIKSALKIGVKKASIELDIPLSNVRRWTSTYQKKVKSGEKDNVLTETSNDVEESDHSISVGIDMAEEDTSDEPKTEHTKPNETAVLSRMLNQGLKNQITKRPLITTGSDLSKKRKLSAGYTDTDRIAYVEESIENGTRYAAEKAGVSLDVMYKWRQKYLPGIRAKYHTQGSPVSKRGHLARGKSTVDETDGNKQTDIDISAVETVTSMNEHVLGNNVNESVLENDIDVLDKNDANDREHLIEASDIPDISVPTFSSDGDLFAVNTDYVGESEALDKDDVIFPEVQDLELDKSGDIDPTFDTAEPDDEVPVESPNLDMIKIVDVKSEYSPT